MATAFSNAVALSRLLIVLACSGEVWYDAWRAGPPCGENAQFPTKERSTMPVPTQEQYIKMLNTAKEKGYAYPAVNVTTIEVINGALKAFAEAKSDGIIQISLGGGQFASGTAVKDSATGAIVLAEAVHRLAEKYDVLVALHTDHCQADKIDSFLRPLIAESKKRIAEGKGPLFNSHMLDASALPMAENLKISKQMLKECAEVGIVLEIEIGVVGGEEDGVDNSGQHAAKLYTSPEDMLLTYETLDGLGEFMLAATFGNVHGVYKPGAVKLEPKILRDGQKAVMDKHGKDMRLVFHGGSGSDLCDIREAISYGVVKMNIDTDTQYAFSKPIVLHMCQNIDGMLKVDGEVGNKKVYDPRSYLKKGEQGICDRLKVATSDLLSEGKTLFGKI